MKSSTKFFMLACALMMSALVSMILIGYTAEQRIKDLIPQSASRIEAFDEGTAYGQVWQPVVWQIGFAIVLFLVAGYYYEKDRSRHARNERIRDGVDRYLAERQVAFDRQRSAIQNSRNRESLLRHYK